MSHSTQIFKSDNEDQLMRYRTNWNDNKSHEKSENAGTWCNESINGAPEHGRRAQLRSEGYGDLRILQQQQQLKAGHGLENGIDGAVQLNLA